MLYLKIDRFVALLLLGLIPISPSFAQNTLRVFLLLGQSNMEGQAYTYDSVETAGWNIPTMEFLLSGTPASTSYRANLPFGFEPSLNATWLDPRSDVWAVHYDSSDGTTKDVQPTNSPPVTYNGIGPLGPGFGVGINFGSMIGPELAMGIRLGDSTADPVFLFKADKGGTTLGNDWRPPTAVAARGGVVGTHYQNSVNSFVAFLDALDADILDDGLLNGYNNATNYVISGLVWFQGWNEQFDDAPYTAVQLQAEYQDNLKDLIYSIRAEDARIPGGLGIIIGESSDQHPGLNASRTGAVAELNGEIPGSAVYFDTAQMKGTDWGNNDLGNPFSQNWGFHFHARAENFLEIGWKAAGAAITNGFLSSNPFWFDTPVLSGLLSSQGLASVNLSADANEVIAVWDLADQGTGAPADWGFQQSLATTNAGLLQQVLSGLTEGTNYIVRFFASNAVMSAVTWSPSASFTTPWLNPPPLLGPPGASGVNSEGATVDSQLRQADAEVTLVWAFLDQGTTNLSDWTGAPGGGSHRFGLTVTNTLVSHNLTGLLSSTSYRFRFHASNSVAEVWSTPGVFNTTSGGSGVGAASLVAYWNFDSYVETGDNPAGTPQGNREGWYEDVTGNNHTCFVADVSSDNFLPHDPAGGRFGGAFYSETSANHGSLGVVFHTDAINFSAEDFTIAFWEKVQFRDVASGGWAPGRGRTQWFMKAPYITNPGELEGLGLNLTQNRFDLDCNNQDNFGQTDLAWYTYPGGGTPDDSDQWAHWAIVGYYDAIKNSYTITTYLNAVAVDWNGAVGTGLVVTNDIIDNLGDLTLGSFWRNNGWAHQRFISWNMKDGVAQTKGKGWMDDFALWEMAITPADVADLAAGIKQPPDIGSGGFDIELIKNVDVPNMLFETSLVYTITIANYSTTTVMNLSVTDSLPVEVTFVSSAPAAMMTNGNVFSYNLGMLAGGADTSIVIQAMVNSPLPGMITNWAIATVTNLELNLDNNQDWAVTILPDTDGDGVNNPFDPDDDGDRMTDEDEWVAGTSSIDPLSYLWLGIERTTNELVRLISFPSVTGRTYRLEFSTNKLLGAWGTVQNNILGTGARVQVLHTNSQPGMHYRLGAQTP